MFFFLLSSSWTSLLCIYDKLNFFLFYLILSTDLMLQYSTKNYKNIYNVHFVVLKWSLFKIDGRILCFLHLISVNTSQVVIYYKLRKVLKHFDNLFFKCKNSNNFLLYVVHIQTKVGLFKFISLFPGHLFKNVIMLRLYM